MRQIHQFHLMTGDGADQGIAVGMVSRVVGAHLALMNPLRQNAAVGMILIQPV